MNRPPTGGLIISMQSGQRFRGRLTRGQSTKSGDFVTLLSAFVLDWTESPYVAAFFAFSEIPKYDFEKDGKVRIYILDGELWHKKHHRVFSINDPRPSFSVHIFNARDNKRAMPQQAVVTFSNICDIEGFIEHHEKGDNMRYLTRIDVPMQDRETAMKELQYMGITAALMFPGLDGTCRALKERIF